MPEVDVEGGRVVVDPPAGLLDLGRRVTARRALMRIDVVSIFPDYLAPLDLSLIGKARARRAARPARARPARLHPRPAPHRRRHPYGGGAGMVMRPEPWAEALDHVARRRRPRRAAAPAPDRPGPGGRAVHPGAGARARRRSRGWPSPAGATRASTSASTTHAREDRMPVSVVSLGDYVLNGGEVAVLAMVEAVGRLRARRHRQRRVARRGVARGRPARVPRLHQAPRVERPRGAAGAPLGQPRRHRRVAARAAARAHRRPPPRPAARLARRRGRRDRRRHAGRRAGAHRALQACWVQEAVANDTLDIPALPRASTTSGEPRHDADVGGPQGRPPRRRGAHVATRRRLVHRPLCVAPDLQGRGLGRRLLEHAESTAPDGIRTISLTRGRAAPTTCGCTGRPATASSPDAPGCPPGAVHLTKRPGR